MNGEGDRLPEAQAGRKFLVDGETWNKMKRLVELAMVLFDPEDFDVIQRAGKRIVKAKPAPAGVAGAAGGGRGSATILPAAYTKEVSGETVTWSVIFTPGSLFEHSMKNAGLEHEIQAGGGTLNTLPPPEIGLSGGDNEVWVQWEVDTDGSVVADSASLSIGDAPTPTAMEPERPEGGGVTGTEVQKIGVITVEDGASPSWRPCAPAVGSQCYVTGIENAGDGIPVWESWAGGKDRFRTIKSVAGSGEAVLHTEVAGAGEVIEFRRISEATASSPQIQVNHSDGIIEIKGNDYDSTVSDAKKVSVVVRDGLVTSLSQSGADTGFTGTLTYVVIDAGSSSSGAEFIMDIEDGLIKQIAVNGGAYQEAGSLNASVTITHPEA